MKEKIEEILKLCDGSEGKLANAKYILESGAVKGKMQLELSKLLSCGHVVALIDVKANKNGVESLIETLKKCKYKITVKYCLAESLSSKILLCDEGGKEIDDICTILSDDVRMVVVMGGCELITYCQYRFKKNEIKIVAVLSEPIVDIFDDKKTIIENKKLIKFDCLPPSLTVIDSDVIFMGNKNIYLYTWALCNIGGFYLVECYYHRAKKGNYSLNFLTALEEEYIVVMKNLTTLSKSESGEGMLSLLALLSLARMASGTADLNIGGVMLSGISAQCEEMEQENFALLVAIVLKNYYLRLNKICGLYLPANRGENQRAIMKNLRLNNIKPVIENRTADYEYENFILLSEAKELLKRIVILDKISPQSNIKSFAADKGYGMKKVHAVKYIPYIKSCLELLSEGTLLKNIYAKGLV